MSAYSSLPRHRKHQSESSLAFDWRRELPSSVFSSLLTLAKQYSLDKMKQNSCTPDTLVKPAGQRPRFTLNESTVQERETILNVHSN